MQGAFSASRLTLMSPRSVAMVSSSGRSFGGLPGGKSTFFPCGPALVVGALRLLGLRCLLVAAAAGGEDEKGDQDERDQAAEGSHAGDRSHPHTASVAPGHLERLLVHVDADDTGLRSGRRHAQAELTPSAANVESRRTGPQAIGYLRDQPACAFLGERAQEDEIVVERGELDRHQPVLSLRIPYIRPTTRSTAPRGRARRRANTVEALLPTA